MTHPMHRPILAMQLCLLFFAYPLLLVSPVGTGWILDQTTLRLPVVLLAGALAGIWLLRVSPPQKGPLLGVAVAYSVWTLCGSWMSPRFHLEAVLNALAWPWILLQFALVARQDLRGLLHLLRRACSLIFLISCLHSWISLYFYTRAPGSDWLDHPLVGLAGNPNWHAALLLACSFPFVVELRGLLPQRRWSWPCAAGLTAALGLIPLLNCSWRSGLLVLPVLAVWALCLRLPPARRLPALLLMAMASGAAAMILMQRPEIRERYELIKLQDVRGPLWSLSLSMSREKALLGQGAGNFQREASRFDSPEHMLKLNAPDFHEHPHNEVLRVACEQGWLTALLWLVLISWAFSRPPPPGARCLAAAALVLLIAGFTDKALHMPPGSLLFPILIGALLFRRARPSSQELPLLLRFAATALLAGLALALAWLVLSGTHHKRLGDRAFSEARAAELRGEAGAAGLLLRQAADDYGRAALILYWDVEAPFLAARVHLMNLRNAENGLPWLERSENLEASYAQSGRLRHLYHRLIADSLPPGPQRQQQLESALQSLIEEIQRHQGNVNLAYELYQFLALSGGKPDEGWKAFIDIAASRGQQKLALMRCDATELRQQIRQGSGEELSRLNHLFAAVRFLGGVDPSLNGLPVNQEFIAESFEPVFTPADLVYFRERLALSDLLDKTGRTEAAVQQLMAQIQIDHAAPFTRPGTTQRLGRGSQLSRFCLEAELRRQAGLGEFRAPAGEVALIWAYPEEWAPRNAALAAILNLPSFEGPALRLHRMHQSGIRQVSFVPAAFQGR
ncbi:MAG: hypothetical protein RL095_1265 [Verrucomicrobiota bacterium]|jgi:O-antigen ligase